MFRGQVSNICQMVKRWKQSLAALSASNLPMPLTLEGTWRDPTALATSGWHYIKYVTKHSDLVRQKRKNDVEMSAIYRHLLSKMFKWFLAANGSAMQHIGWFCQAAHEFGLAAPAPGGWTRMFLDLRTLLGLACHSMNRQSEPTWIK